jgi:EAL domain-containing protein (putative c-di-GMP-specific phosphodiesterase class I)
VRAVIDLAHALNVTTVAEGVENARSQHGYATADAESRKASTTARPSRPPR